MNSLGYLARATNTSSFLAWSGYLLKLDSYGYVMHSLHGFKFQCPGRCQDEFTLDPFF